MPVYLCMGFIIFFDRMLQGKLKQHCYFIRDDDSSCDCIAIFFRSVYK